MENIPGTDDPTDAIGEAIRTELPDDGITAVLTNLIRGKSTSLAAFLSNVESDALVDDTRAICHTHFIDLDGNGQPRSHTHKRNSLF